LLFHAHKDKKNIQEPPTFETDFLYLIFSPFVAEIIRIAVWAAHRGAAKKSAARQKMANNSYLRLTKHRAL